MNKPEFRDAALLVLRFVVGAIFIAHGWDKVMITGLSTTGGQFDQLGIPQPNLVAPIVAALEMVGGAMIMVGILAPAASIVLVGDMVGAIWFVHRHNGFFVADGGWEFVLLLIACLVTIIVFGAGRASLDYAFQRKK